MIKLSEVIENLNYYFRQVLETTPQSINDKIIIYVNSAAASRQNIVCTMHELGIYLEAITSIKTFEPLTDHPDAVATMAQLYYYDGTIWLKQSIANSGGVGDIGAIDLINNVIFNNYFYVDGSRTDVYTPNGSITKPYTTVLAAMTAINASSAALALAGTYERSKYVLKIAPGTYSDNIVINDQKYLKIEMTGVIISGTIDITTTQQTGDYYSKIEFVGGMSNRVEKGDNGELSGVITCTRNNDSLQYMSFTGIEISNNLLFSNNGTWVVFSNHSYFSNGSAFISGDFSGAGSPSVLLESMGKTRIKAHIADTDGSVTNVALYDCSETEFDLININSTFGGMLRNCTFKSDVTIAAGTYKIDNVSYKEIVAQTETLIGATIAFMDSYNGGDIEVAGHISITGTGNSVFIGEDAGLNDDLTNNKNVYIGYEAGKNATTGLNNVVIGYKSGVDTNAGQNVFIGYFSGYSNTSGYYNTGIGCNSLQDITSEVYNTGVGFYTLKGVTGEKNTALGSEAGLRITSGSNITIANNSIFIGFDSRANDNSETNQIVLGADAIGNGSNTATILDDNGTDVYMGEDAQCVMHSKAIKTTLLSGALTNPPTAAELIALVGVAATLGSGYEVNVWDSANSIMYNVNTDGTDWFYVVKTKAV